MQIERYSLPGLSLLLPQRHRDDRGYLAETFQSRRMGDAVGMAEVLQENLVWSEFAATVRGLHAQVPPNAQAKLVTVLAGSILDVAVDVRRGSPTFGRHLAIELTAAMGSMLYVPKGFLHGYRTLEPNTLVQYKLDAYYQPAAEIAVRFDDPDLAIDWRVPHSACHVSDKDCAAGTFADFDTPFAFDPAL